MPTWWPSIRAWRDARTLRRRPIPEPLWSSALQDFPFLARRSDGDLEHLRTLSTLFLADKEFTGAQGLQVGDAMAVAIAAQACLPILRLGLHHYDGFKGIVVQPDVVVARREVMDEDGIVHQYDEELAGEAMQGGPVMLSWSDVAAAGESAPWGYNVVVHEFAHVLDLRDGRSDGVPPLADREVRRRWIEVIEREWQLFSRQVDAGRETLLDPYGAQSVDEFFAVASEAFFVAPVDLRREQPELYALLRSYYRQNPADPLGRDL